MDQEKTKRTTLGQILERNNINKVNKGLSSLLSVEANDTITKHDSVDQLLITNEFLKLEKQKTQLLENTLHSLGTIPDKLAKLDYLSEELDKQKYKLQADRNLLKDLIKKNTLFFYSTIGVLLAVLFTLYFRSPKKEVILKQVTPVKIQAKTHYVTMKFVNLRSSSSPKSNAIITISPNQKLKELEVKGSWIKVSYTDYVSKLEHKGWVYFENIRKLENN